MDKISVKCKDCGKVYKKRKDTLSRWTGRCQSCSSKEIVSRPTVKNRLRISARKQMLKLWKNPLYRKMMSKAYKRKKGSKSPCWIGGKNRFPKCLDCRKQLASYSAKRCPSCFYKTKIGIKRSLKTRRKCSVAQKGEKAHNWRGGISKVRDIIYRSIEYKLWREAVFARDNYTCQKCNKKHGDIEAHHIKSFSEYPELIFTVSNGHTLCNKCHKKTDNYGFKQANKNKHKLRNIAKYMPI